MPLVNFSHRPWMGSASRRRLRHATCGVVGFAVVVTAFLALYATIASLSVSLLGVLSSTAITALFIGAWLLLWIVLEMLVVWLRSPPVD